jgi:hypothetical protein
MVWILVTRRVSNKELGSINHMETKKHNFDSGLDLLRSLERRYGRLRLDLGPVDVSDIPDEWKEKVTGENSSKFVVPMFEQCNSVFKLFVASDNIT